MNENACDHAIRIVVTNNHAAEAELNDAVNRIRERAMKERRRGILVTHESPGQFTVALSDDVPFGLTKEMQAW